MLSDSSATIVTDLGYGDAGKGSIVDYLARSEDARLVVRFNGGAQAGHNVVTPDGRHHTFRQFGSASFVPGARTHLSRHVLVSPLALSHEADELYALGVPEPHKQLTIDRAARIVTPYHEAANRLREIARGNERHGSCGYGIGETLADSIEFPDDTIVVGDLASRIAVTRKLESVRLRKLEQFQEIVGHTASAVRNLKILQDIALSEDVADFYKMFARNVAIVGEEYLGRLLEEIPHVIFEGAQGVLLDEWRGFHPHTTWSTTTFANADKLLFEYGYIGEITHLGVLRSYATRHGPGPFVTEDRELTRSLPDTHNDMNQWQRQFRVGHFDLVAARYALEVAGTTDCLAITCLDQYPVSGKICTSYRHQDHRVNRLVPGAFQDLGYQEKLTNLLLSSTPEYEEAPASQSEFLEYLEKQLRVPIAIVSRGPTAREKTRTLWSAHNECRCVA